MLHFFKFYRPAKPKGGFSQVGVSTGRWSEKCPSVGINEDCFKQPKNKEINKLCFTEIYFRLSTLQYVSSRPIHNKTLNVE